jgi:hypothetical protein
MKKLFLLILLLLISALSYAQLSAGLKLNWNFNRLIIKTASANENYSDPHIGIEKTLSLSGSAMAKYRLNHRFSMQSELVFDAFKTNFAKIEYTNQQDETATYNNFNINMNYLEIPCMAKISFGNKVTFDIFSGGYVGYLLSAKQSTDDGVLSVPNQLIPINYPPHNVRREYTSFNAGVLAGLSVTMDNRMVFELRLNRGLVNINKNGSAKMYTLQGQFSVGWYLFRQKKKA